MSTDIFRFAPSARSAWKSFDLWLVSFALQLKVRLLALILVCSKVGDVRIRSSHGTLSTEEVIRDGEFIRAGIDTVGAWSKLIRGHDLEDAVRGKIAPDSHLCGSIRSNDAPPRAHLHHPVPQLPRPEHWTGDGQLRHKLLRSVCRLL